MKQQRLTMLKAFFISTSYANLFMIFTCILEVEINPAFIVAFVGTASFTSVIACYMVYSLLLELLMLKASIRSFNKQIQGALDKVKKPIDS